MSAPTSVEDKAQVLERLREDERFLLAGHENPDGDALGSLVAMHGLLRALGKDAAMFISSEDLPLPYEYRSFFDLRGALHESPADIAQRTVVFLDCGNIDRNAALVLPTAPRCSTSTTTTTTPASARSTMSCRTPRARRRSSGI